MRVIFISLLLCFVQSFGVGTSDAQQCQAINVDLCRSLPYNLTRLPNTFGHSTQKAVNNSLWARAQEFNALCSDYLLFFVCTIHLPICIEDESLKTPYIEPCRSVCEKVKADCNATMQSNSMTWPDDRQFMCERLPTYNDSICMKPAAFVDSTADQNPVCKDSQGRPRLTRDRFRRANFSFAFKGTVVSITQNPDGSFSIQLNVTRVIIRSRSRSNTVLIWSLSKCSCEGSSSCTAVEPGKEFVFIGYKDAIKGLSVQFGYILAFPRDRQLIEKIKRWKSKLTKKKD